MRKVFKGALPILLMVVGIFSLVSLAQASFWIAGMGAYYSPNYGDIKDSVDRINTYYGTGLELKAGSGFVFSSGYDFSERWGLRLDAFTFEAKTSSTVYIYYLPLTVLVKTSTTPIILSAIYRVPSEGKLHPYFGAGIGSFPSKTTVQAAVLGYGVEWSESDSPMGFQILGGAEYRLENGFFIRGELRYLSAETDYPTLVPTDWSGILAGIGVGLKF